jgi:hypothetical protein
MPLNVEGPTFTRMHLRRPLGGVIRAERWRVLDEAADESQGRASMIVIMRAVHTGSSPASRACTPSAATVFPFAS